MGIGREYIDKVRNMDDDEKQELMNGFHYYFLASNIGRSSFDLMVKPHQVTPFERLLISHGIMTLMPLWLVKTLKLT